MDIIYPLRMSQSQLRQRLRVPPESELAIVSHSVAYEQDGKKYLQWLLTPLKQCIFKNLQDIIGLIVITVRFGSTDNEDCYTSNISCGMPIIININDFYVGDDFSVQADIKLDGNYLRETLLYLGFKVEMHEDLTAAQ
ncbi:unnamed protein product [Didymodactylos carnosus]|uniref:Caspase family p20 domain-containing protein n=1 Tax=Didymodactylos carnosus TaxID=1234261 RepID=A0A8S2KBG3_9BILA|nr:unnamed protein product [Didymodactylos carnosus]CAF3846441.1 unnamed protein product [Didymodactylos carnosus]